MSSDTQSRYDAVRLYYRLCINMDRYFLNCSYRTILELAFTYDMLDSFCVTKGREGTFGKLLPDSEITKTANSITYMGQMYTRDGMTYIFTGRIQDLLREQKVDYSTNDLQYIESIKLLSML